MGINGIYLGIGLMIIGLVLFAFGNRKKSSATASHGSVAVGGNNTGPIINVNQQRGQSSHASGHGLTVVAIIVEIGGIAVTLWHALHLAAK